LVTRTTKASGAGATTGAGAGVTTGAGAGVGVGAGTAGVVTGAGAGGVTTLAVSSFFPQETKRAPTRRMVNAMTRTFFIYISPYEIYAFHSRVQQSTSIIKKNKPIVRSKEGWKRILDAYVYTMMISLEALLHCLGV
jgi:hypothetical protein